MPSIGETLRQARLDRRLTIPEVAGRTCVSARYLQAIEADDAKLLPGAFFYRSFIRLYAEAVGLDAEPLLRRVDPNISGTDQDVLPVLSASYVPAGRAAHGPRFRIPLAIAALLATVSAGSFFYSWWDRSQRTELAVDAAAVAPPRTPVALPPTPVESQPAASAEPQPASIPETPPAPAPAAAGTVRLAATEQTWVSVSANGKTLFRGVLRAAETRQFDGLEQAKLVTGNAAGLGIEWNGRDLGPIGPRGQVRLVLLNGQDARIVTPRGM